MSKNPKETIVYRYSAETGVYVDSLLYTPTPDTLPPDCTTEKKPIFKDGFYPVWNGQKWEQLEDHRGETVYAKDLSACLHIDTLGIIPDGFVSAPPPAFTSGFIIEWNEEKQEWQYVEDHRGVVGYINGEEVVIKETGPLPADFTLDPPPTPEPEPEPEIPADPVAIRLREIDAELSNLDRAWIRPYRATQDGTATDEDAVILDYITERVKELRAERKELTANQEKGII